MEKVPVLLYDGLCAFCNGWVKFILKHDKAGAIKFAPLQGSYAAELHERHPWIREVDSIVLAMPADESERIAVRSEAALRLASYLGGVWRLAAAARIVPRGVRDWAYDVVAKYRYRLFGRFESCPVPDPQVRHRFLA